MKSTAAEVEARDGLVRDAFGATEVALGADSEDLIYRPNVLNLHGNLWPTRGRSELTDADFREAIAMAKKRRGVVLRARFRNAEVTDGKGN